LKHGGLLQEEMSETLSCHNGDHLSPYRRKGSNHQIHFFKALGGRWAPSIEAQKWVFARHELEGEKIQTIKSIFSRRKEEDGLHPSKPRSGFLRVLSSKAKRFKPSNPFFQGARRKMGSNGPSTTKQHRKNGFD